MIDRSAIAKDFIASRQSQLPKEKLDAAVNTILNTTTKYPTSNGSVICAIFYMRFTVDCEKKAFIGNAGGLGTVGGGALLGDIYTNDIAKLFRSTISFHFAVTPVYASLVFFDKDSVALGTFQAGAVSVCLGTGGGSGSWS